MSTANTPRAATCRRCESAFTVPTRIGRLPNLCPTCRSPKTMGCRLCGVGLFPNEHGCMLCIRCRGTVQAARLCLKTMLKEYIEVLAPGVYAIRPGAKEIAELLAVETGLEATVEQEESAAA